MARQYRTEHMYNLHFLNALNCDFGSYGMPVLDPVDVVPARLVNGTNLRAADEASCAHWFIDDYKMEMCWKDPMRYVAALGRLACTLSPDFSVFVEMPTPMQMWNVYRGRAVARIWQDAGLAVVPSVTFGAPETHGFCFDGIPTGSTIALSSVGLMNSREGRALFVEGASAAARALRPARVLAYGVPCAFDSGESEVVWYESDMQKRYRELKEARSDG